MRRADRFALLLAVLAVVISAWISQRIFEGIPHIEDEMAYVWQAQVISRGEVMLASPPCPRCFFVPFVVDYQGWRFGKYPLGWPVVLALGLRAGLRFLVNPLLAGLSLWLFYRLGSRLADRATGLLCAALSLTSPYFLMNSASLLAHPWGLFLTSALALSWIDLTQPRAGIPRWLPVGVAGLCLGNLALTRPLTAVGIGLPFALHGLICLLRGQPAARRAVLATGLIALATASLHFLWQYVITGSPWTNPYTLWWPYDKVGFGPGVGLNPGGNSLNYALQNANYSLWVGARDWFGWLHFSWLFLPVGLWAIRRKPYAWLIAATFPSLVAVYFLYWIGSWILGPRYYYEAWFALVFLSAVGIRWAAGRLTADAQPRRRWLAGIRFGGVSLAVGLLLVGNLVFYLPQRLDGLRGFYDVHADRIAPFQTPQAQKLTPALVFVHVEQNWIEYGNLLDLTSPFMDSPFLLVYNRSEAENRAVMQAFPQRHAYHYYMQTPGRFSSAQP